MAKKKAEKGAKSSEKSDKTTVKRGRGRPKGSKNKIKPSKLKRSYVKKLEEDILKTPAIKDLPKQEARTVLDQILFKIPTVKEPLEGTPKEVQKKLDCLAKKMQKDEGNDEIFDTIHHYMHAYLVNVVLNKFPFIKGSQTVDIYQETLIALRFKAIPNFKKNKGMSFLNFAKMCIRRHLITLLHASRNRVKDKAINFAVSLDSSPSGDETDGKNTFANTVSDGKDTHDTMYEKNEAYEKTKVSLLKSLSEFERVVLEEYLSSSSYKEIATNISLRLEERHNAKSIDNALLRIRKKATHLKIFAKPDDIPIFIERTDSR